MEKQIGLPFPCVCKRWVATGPSVVVCRRCGRNMTSHLQTFASLKEGTLASVVARLVHLSTRDRVYELDRLQKSEISPLSRAYVKTWLVMMAEQLLPPSYA
jgi:hypothetical protein